MTDDLTPTENAPANDQMRPPRLPHEQAPNPLGLCQWHYWQFKTHTLPPTPTTQHTSTAIAWHLIDRTIGWNHTQRHIARTLGVNKDCIYHIHKRTYARVKRTNWQKSW